MELARHLDGIRSALDAFASHASDAGLDTPVPTTPDWEVRRLVVHQGMVHRWATGTIEGRKVSAEASEAEGLDTPDPVTWLREGGERLLAALEAAPADLDVLVFLDDAPPARQFWARRQCHETTIHAVDALAASLGRYPRAADTWVEVDVALDGIDELVTGFLPRRTSRLRTEVPTTVAILPEDGAASWLVSLSDQPPVTTRGAGDDDADIVVRGPAVALYLTLWNRSDEISAEGFGLWSREARVELATSHVLVPVGRLPRWVDNFEASHGAATFEVGSGAWSGLAGDGSTFVARLPFDTPYDGPGEVGAFVAAAEPPAAWGVLLVRKGGFAVARLTGTALAEHKIGQRHVQGRTKAGGQSQQRFARRRDNQARQAYEAAAEHAVRILGRETSLGVVTGGDHAAVDEVLGDPRLHRLTVVGPWLPVPEPRRAVLDAAIADALSVRIEVHNAG